MEFKEIISPLEFKDISGESYRTYYYLDGSKFIIENPIAICVSESGGHKIINSEGKSIYIKNVWIAFEFKAIEGREHWRF